MRVLVADDSVLFRRLMSEVLAEIPGVEVVGQARDGREALEIIRTSRPDVVTLDMEMPGLNGLQVLEALEQSAHKPCVIVVSSGSYEDGLQTISALRRGAVDFITKPVAPDIAATRKALHAKIEPLLALFTVRNTPPEIKPVTFVPVAASKPGMVVIGVSTGGPNALADLIPALPGNLNIPLFIVQHMPPHFTRSLAESLDQKSALHVKEATDKELAQPNTVYIAPGGQQMRLVPSLNGQPMIRISDDPPENNCRPSVDYLFRSVAASWPGQALSVILTGMGSDGLQGVRMLRESGSVSIAQDANTCVVYGMPRAIVDAGLAHHILPLSHIAGMISSLVNGGVR
jgi:two-component system, chemotaxis family, protein-glutamate methylesterase/glutaminase